MLIRDTIWEKIRSYFSEDEKKELRRAVTGESICPRGFFIDENLNGLPTELVVRLKAAIRGVK